MKGAAHCNPEIFGELEPNWSNEVVRLGSLFSLQPRQQRANGAVRSAAMNQSSLRPTKA